MRVDPAGATATPLARRLTGLEPWPERELGPPHTLVALTVRRGCGSPFIRHLPPCTARLTVDSEKDAKLAQKLGQLQAFMAVFPQECVGQLAPFGPT